MQFSSLDLRNVFETITSTRNLVYLLIIATTFFNLFSNVQAIGCYKCSSTNNDSTCIDPFNPGHSPTSFYEQDCKSGIPGRTGLFPARFCLKVSGTIAKTNEQIVIRTCTVSKLLDSDSSHSSFTLKLDDNTEVQVMSGLIASCKDDGCNLAQTPLRPKSFIFIYIMFFMVLIYIFL